MEPFFFDFISNFKQSADCRLLFYRFAGERGERSGRDVKDDDAKDDDDDDDGRTLERTT
jgi:hypothetical protein